MKIAIGTLACALTFAVPHASAQSVPVTTAATTSGTVTVDDLFGGTTGQDFASTSGLGSGDLTTTLASVIRAMLGFLGFIAVFVVLLGGWKWMMSQGDEKKVLDAKKFMINGIIGLVVILGAYAISYFALNAATTAFQTAETTE